MSGEPAISVQSLGKRYRIGLEEQRHETLAGVMGSWLRSPLNNYRKLKSLTSFGNGDSSDIVWALSDVSFEVHVGETVGLIGRNGAGKSTLLKILSRITEPTCGTAHIRGRVASLLEVGTGFHPELTGRENVYLNGTLLGMSRREIDTKFDEIVAFSGIERFVDTPVKRYSSGMRVRLAFSVAAYLEPEILLVDEVLAVGDVAFQKKCLGKMDDVARGGRTVVFVSHNMAMVQSLCKRGILMQDGSIVYDGPVGDTIGEYMKSAKESAQVSLADRLDRRGGRDFRFRSVDFLDPSTALPIDVIVSGQPVLIKIGYDVSTDSGFDHFATIMSFYTAGGSFMFACSNEFVGKKVDTEKGPGATYCYVPKWPLDRGEFYFDLFAGNGKGVRLDHIKEAGFIEVRLGDYYNKGHVKPVVNQQGMFVDFEWFNEEEVSVLK